MTFKGSDAFMKGNIPLELPLGYVMADAQIVVEYDGTVSFKFSHAEFARMLMIQGLENNLIAFRLDMIMAQAIERRSDETRTSDQRGSSTS